MEESEFKKNVSLKVLNGDPVQLLRFVGVKKLNRVRKVCAQERSPTTKESFTSGPPPHPSRP